MLHVSRAPTRWGLVDRKNQRWLFRFKVERTNWNHSHFKVHTFMSTQDSRGSSLRESETGAKFSSARNQRAKPHREGPERPSHEAKKDECTTNTDQELSSRATKKLMKKLGNSSSATPTSLSMCGNTWPKRVWRPHFNVDFSKIWSKDTGTTTSKDHETCSTLFPEASWRCSTRANWGGQSCSPMRQPTITVGEVIVPCVPDSSTCTEQRYT